MALALKPYLALPLVARVWRSGVGHMAGAKVTSQYGGTLRATLALATVATGTETFRQRCRIDLVTCTHSA